MSLNKGQKDIAGLLAEWREVTDKATPGEMYHGGPVAKRFTYTSRTAMPALLTAVENVLNDHEPEPYAQGADYCRECCHRWPCATYAAIRDALGGAQ